MSYVNKGIRSKAHAFNYLLFSDPKILILGAGIAGVTAAETLKGLGYNNFQIIEGAGKVGGRAAFPIDLGGYTVELGAVFVNGAETNPLFPFLQKYNLSWIRPDPDDYIVRNTDGSDVTDLADRIFEKRFKPATDKVEAYAEKAQAEGRPGSSLRSALTKAGWIPKTFLDDVIEYNEFDYSYAFDPGEISGIHDFLDDPAETVNYTLEVIKADSKGYEHMVREMLNETIGGQVDKLILNKIVTEIERKADKVEVRTTSGDNFTADYVILTFSLGVLKTGRVKFTPPLPEWKMDSIAQFQMAYYTNIYVQFDHCFWDDATWILYAGERENFNNLINFNKIFPGSNILNLEATNRESIRIERLSDAEVIDEVVEKLRKIYGPSNITVPYPIRYGIGRFSRNPLFEGAYSNWPPGYGKDSHEALKAPVERIYFAGEHTSYFYYGYMHGAYESGIEIAKALDKCIKNADCQDYAPLYASRGCRYSTASNYDAKAKVDDGTCQFKCDASAAGQNKSQPVIVG